MTQRLCWMRRDRSLGPTTTECRETQPTDAAVRRS